MMTTRGVCFCPPPCTFCRAWPAAGSGTSRAGGTGPVLFLPFPNRAPVKELLVTSATQQPVVGGFQPTRLCEGSQLPPWTTTEVRSRSPQPPVELCALPTAARRPHVRLASCTEIGIGLTGAGLLFMVLGMMMFFDKGLLAMGNVRRVTSGPRLDIAAVLRSRLPASPPADPVPCGCHDDHRHEQDLPFLLPETQAQVGARSARAGRLTPRHLSRAATPLQRLPSHPALPPARHRVLLGRHRVGAARLAGHWHGRRGLRVPQPIRVHRACPFPFPFPFPCPCPCPAGGKVGCARQGCAGAASDCEQV